MPLGLALSFFVFWALSGTGQPGNMVRLMAFDNSATLKKAIASLSLYFTLIYFPLVIIFCCARVLAPGLDQTPDRIMPVMSFQLTQNAGIPWLAGILIAAPFAAAMSTVDSFMLMISSSVVRDIYQRNINPEASQKVIKRMSYGCTLVVGVFATLGAVNPPQFLQYVIVFTSGGLAVAFLAPVSLGLYWPRFTAAGAIASMLGGLAAYLSLYLAGFVLYGENIPVRPMGFDPLIWGFAASLIFAVAVTWATKPPPANLVRRFF
jgi:SSS family solute:Na+ symporter/sodium/pantothenate symporter